MFYLSTHHLTCYTLPALPVVEMAHSSNVFIHGATFNSAQGGDIHINSKESDMQGFKSVQQSIFIDNPMKAFRT